MVVPYFGNRPNVSWGAVERCFARVFSALAGLAGRLLCLLAHWQAALEGFIRVFQNLEVTGLASCDGNQAASMALAWVIYALQF